MARFGAPSIENRKPLGEWAAFQVTLRLKKKVLAQTSPQCKVPTACMENSYLFLFPEKAITSTRRQQNGGAVSRGGWQGEVEQRSARIEVGGLPEALAPQ